MIGPFGRLGLLLSFAIAACDAPAIVGDPAADTIVLAMELVATGLDQPVALVVAPGGTGLFVAERTGRIRILDGGAVLDTAFLDLTGVAVASGGERGLLGLAFAPDYQTTGHFWVSYTDVQGDSRIVRYARSAANADRADPASAATVLVLPQPFGNHNGGQITFGPDGMLYAGFGDGGSAGDPLGAGQDRATLLGALLRLDVRSAQPYAVPPDNPFVGDPSARPEIWAYGLRNPWRWSFDGPTDRLYLADVGQDRFEEINAVPRSLGGVNYGWNIREGAACFQATTCPSAGLTEPVLTYSHDDGCSVIGGFVYRGTQLPELAGHYFYADYCGGWLRSFRLEGQDLHDQREWDVGSLGAVTSFGRDATGELYVLTAGGEIMRIVRRT